MTQRESKPIAVAGFVKGKKPNKDGSITFFIAGKRFVLHENGPHAQTLQKARRALVLFSENDKGSNPKIVAVFSEPSGRLVLQHQER